MLGEDCDLEPAEKFRCEKQPSNFNLKVVLDKVPLPSFKPAPAVSAPLDPEDEIEEIEDVEEIDETDEFDESLVDDSLILNISDTSFYMKSSTVSSDDLDLPRRNMRSQNAEFSIKQQVFLNKIQSEIADVSELSEEDVDADKMSEESSNNIVEKRKRVVEKAVKVSKF